MSSQQQVGNSKKYRTIQITLLSLLELFFLPLYDFFLSPFFYHYTPTILKSIAAGILLISISHFLSAVVGMLQVCSTADNKSCIVQSVVFNVSEKWPVVDYDSQGNH